MALPVRFLITYHLYVKLTFTSFSRALNTVSPWICIAPELMGPNPCLVIVHARASEVLEGWLMHLSSPFPLLFIAVCGF